jgi:hypothetical protein
VCRACHLYLLEDIGTSAGTLHTPVGSMLIGNYSPLGLDSVEMPSYEVCCQFHCAKIL